MPQTTISGADTFVLQETISAYMHEEYTTAKKLSGTGIVGSNPEIDVNTETFIGQVRWFKPFGANINVASLTNAEDGLVSTYGSDYLTYIKTVRTYGAEKVNMQQVVTQVDGLLKIGRDFAEHRAQDEHDAILSVLKGVAISEVLYGTASGTGQIGLGGQNWDTDPTEKRYGFYVDNGNSAPLIKDAAVAVQGASRAESFLQAIGKAWKDYEPPYAYLVATPQVMSSLRSANLVDKDGVVDGNITFNTIFQGKLRLIQTRANQGFTSAEMAVFDGGVGAAITGTKVSFVVLPGALAMQPLSVPEPVEITRDGAKYKGGGKTSIWNRWGYVLAPGGYSWIGKEDRFAANEHYMAVIDSVSSGGSTAGTGAPFAASNNGTVAANTPQSLGGYKQASWSSGAIVVPATLKGTWQRKTASALSLGILPIFHG